MHEVLHFMLGRYAIYGRDTENLHHNLRGLAGRPITNSRINNAILEKLRQYVPRKSTEDR